MNEPVRLPQVPKSYRCGPVTMIPRGGRWHFRYQLGNERKLRTTREPLKNRARAEQVALDAYDAAKLRARGEEPEPRLHQAVDLWIRANALAKSRSHIENIETFGRKHLNHLADLRLTQLTTAQVEDARRIFMETHAASSANQWLTYLRLICHWAIRRKMIRAMPFDVAELKVKRVRKPLLPKEKVSVWLAEVDALTEHEPSLGLVLRLEIGLGLRGSEARQARWEWLDIERRTYTPGDTKGGEAWARPVPEWLLAELQRIAKPLGWMVPGLAGTPVSLSRVQRIIDAACKAIGIPRFTAHRLRATYATWLADEGVPLHTIKNALGHKDIRTTEGYLQVDMRGVAEAQKRIAIKTGMSGIKSGNPTRTHRD
ncbi:site-specific integrase [Geothrix sp. PMB-07]|uniref:tyrosine-type recombinase/integrase n=1 Tax=Geothrix sp. PMB-07 TaxID=3068640 RepID=UPI002740E102|nr:site-specific integrase [Geothrix sp. PMB-07]WLT30083.1 site-specific integrase [Geothrix sp. PMB-07]